ncbi:Ankyrin repeat domain-containing protein 1 [Hondaea fermentalgiana]|uniref:Ankyrin repeat domain-containing protein 1 n=1 Tax=Hondaea fermentalgiana TaxID=2315210 RepID=A0A2R5GJY7_9STRA|nr:Ankyrin repeat domain-containing protein 1 [Hondaea fermentalgiana]|eukprot:GBG31216.1 Ankyrin repeat domain-containing protein 1 [Hondaea fermentalgiana]
MRALRLALAAAETRSEEAAAAAARGEVGGGWNAKMGEPTGAAKSAAPVDVDAEVEHVHGWTALHVACAARRPDAVEALLARGANTEAKSRQFAHTPLHVAACVGSQTAVQNLLDAGAVIQARDENGYTALHYAAVEGYRAVVETLLAAMEARGTVALVNELDKDGCSALTLAQRAMNSKVAETLHNFLATNLAHDLVDPAEIAEVNRWLADDVGLPQYIPGFISAGYTRLAFWAKSGLTEAEFREIGVMLPGHQRIIARFLADYATSGDDDDDGNSSGSESGSGSDASSEAS